MATRLHHVSQAARSFSAFEKMADFTKILNARPTMLQNYKRHGAELGCETYRAFHARAAGFFAAATDPMADRTMYRVFVGPDSIGIDYCFALRGVFTHSGEPISFYVPDYDAVQFPNPKAQLEDFGQTVMRKI